jgi:hypothetical protein
MKKIALVLTLAIAAVALSGCDEGKQTSESRDAKRVLQQQGQYEKAQPIPVFDWSLERHLVVELYKLRNQKVATHSVWRGDLSVVEGDCPSMGYGLPYDSSLTNPLVATNIAQTGERHLHSGGALTSIEQAEPNGIFASKNTNATWVFCIGESGSTEPVYIESKVTVYPGPVLVDYEKNRVTRSGAATVIIPQSE